MPRTSTLVDEPLNGDEAELFRLHYTTLVDLCCPEGRSTPDGRLGDGVDAAEELSAEEQP